MDSCPDHLLDALVRNAMDRPNQPALWMANESVTWRRLADYVHATAVKLEADFSDRNVAHRRLIYACSNTPTQVILSLACIAANVTEVPIDGRFPSEVFDTLMKQTGGLAWTRHAATNVEMGRPWRVQAEESLRYLRDRAQRIDPDAPSLILWTSGTTCSPKGVVLSQRNLAVNAFAKWIAVPQTADDRRLTVLSLAHAYARTCDLGTWLLSGCQLAVGRGHAALDRLPEGYQPTLINATPILLKRWIIDLTNGDRRLAKLRWLGCGGAALDDSTFGQWRSFGVEVIAGYGLTESSPVICSASPGSTMPGSVGKPVPTWETSVREGRLFVRGPGVMLGYLDDEDATRKKIDPDGWLDTSDLVRIHSNGHFQILGRADDVLVLPSGWKVHPKPIEDAVAGITGVEQVVLLLVDDQLRLAVQGIELSIATIESIVHAMLPPSTGFAIEVLDPPLTFERAELTLKGSPRRHVIAKRFQTSVDSNPERNS